MLEEKNQHPLTRNVQVSTCWVRPLARKQKKTTILLVNGHGRGGKLLEDILLSGGHAVLSCSDGKEGVELFKKNNFSLVFTEFEISGLSPWHLAEALKAIKNDIPLILITGWRTQPDKAALEKSRIDLVVHKPFSFNQILKLVQELTHQSGHPVV